MSRKNLYSQNLDKLARRNEDPNHLVVIEDPPAKLSFNSDDWDTLLAFADQIIPATNTNISASEAGFKSFLENAFKSNFDVRSKYSSSERRSSKIRRNFEKLIFSLNYIADRDYRSSFICLAKNNSEKAMVVVSNVERLEPELFNKIRLVVIESYFSHPRHGGNKFFTSWHAIRLVSPVIKFPK